MYHLQKKQISSQMKNSLNSLWSSLNTIQKLMKKQFVWVYRNNYIVKHIFIFECATLRTFLNFHYIYLHNNMYLPTYARINVSACMLWRRYEFLLIKLLFDLKEKPKFYYKNIKISIRFHIHTSLKHRGRDGSWY